MTFGTNIWLNNLLVLCETRILISQRDIVLISFPFSNFQESKVRPVVVMSNDVYNTKFADFIAVPLTSNMKLRNHTVVITSAELETGKLIVDSRAKVDKVFSVEQSLMRKKIGRVKKSVHKNLKQILFEIIG